MAAPPTTSRITVPTVSRSRCILTWSLLVLLVGGHWGMLQVVAWTNMLIDYSRDNTFADAVEMTFGGEYRCNICKQVDDGIAAELGSDERKVPGKTQKTVKLDALIETPLLVMPPPLVQVRPPVPVADDAAGWRGEPPRRPPQLLG